jgi:hypothetical protein
VLVVLGLFFVLWAIDSVNSYFHFFTGRVGLYTPSNSLRLVTGMVNGLSLSLLVFPMFNYILWREPDERRVIDGLGELVGLLLQVFALAVLLQANVSFLVYPLSVLNVLSVLLMLTIVNSMIVMILLRRENRAESGRQAVLPLSLGLLLSIAEVGGIAVLRQVLPSAFPPAGV